MERNPSCRSVLDYYDYFGACWIVELKTKMTQSNTQALLIPGSIKLDTKDSISILVMGTGESGQAMARWAVAQGAQVRMHDTREEGAISEKAQIQLEALKQLNINISFGKNIAGIDLGDVDIIAMSPGISPLDEWIAEVLKNAQEQSKVIWGELDFFTQALEALKEKQNYQPKVVAITGTNGKTTTTALCGVIFGKTGKSVAVAGNISPSLLDKLTQCLTEDQLPDIWVLELSSYQLFYSQNFNPDAATVLNITEDHLDWHGDIEHYYLAKKKIFGQRTIPILNRDDSKVMAMIDEDKKLLNRYMTFGMDTPLEPDSFGIVGDMTGGIDWLAWVMPEEDVGQRKRRRTKVTSNEYDQPLQIKRLIPAEALLIKGRHNATNTLAAIALGQAIDLSMASLLHGLRDYRGEPHRVQSIAVIDDVEYIDDSKGTNVGATLAAINGLGSTEEQKKIILIAGGDGKGQNFLPLREPIHRYTKHVYLLGKDAQKIEDVLNKDLVPITRVGTIEEAVTQAAKEARAGDKVLLSPACASLDMFKDYVHRAEVFANAVEELSHQTHGIEVGL
jgi:UDP-N-acetylmuramoylalanine--D-glutamate ligase